MADYTDMIDRFLKGQMNKQEERVFKSELKSNTALRFQGFIVTGIIKLGGNR